MKMRKSKREGNEIDEISGFLSRMQMERSLVRPYVLKWMTT